MAEIRTEMSVMSYDEFRRFVADTLGIAEEVLTPESNFLIDLAVDSLKLVELMLQFQTELGTTISTDTAWEILTMNDAYAYYVEQARNVAGTA